MKQNRSLASLPIDSKGDDLINYIQLFFLTHFPDLSRPLTLVCGLSGGSDSMALLHLMQQLADRRPLNLIFVHVDHKWRKESSDEAKLLENLCSRLNARFTCQYLSQTRTSNNQEAHGRKERLRIFGNAVKQNRASALVLAHHFDDCLESMLKKIFEGAELSQLGAMRCDVQIGTLRIVRPFLSLDKEFLRSWLTSRKHAYFEDPTNSDSKFWRGFVRAELFGSVQSVLGKEIKAPLKRLWHYAKELEELLDSTLSTSPLAMSWGIAGMWCEIPKGPELLLRHFFRKKVEDFGTHLPHQSNEQLVDAALRKTSNRSFRFNSCKALIWHNLIFLEHQKSLYSGPQEPLRIDKAGEYQIGIWKVRAHRSSNPHPFQTIDQGWRSIWKGEFSASIEAFSPLLCLPLPGFRIKGRKTTLAAWWNKKGVPPPLRRCVPVAVENEEVVDEWLSGSCCQMISDEKKSDGAQCRWILHFNALSIRLAG